MKETDHEVSADLEAGFPGTFPPLEASDLGHNGGDEDVPLPPLILPDLHGTLRFLDQVVLENPGRRIVLLGDLFGKGHYIPQLLGRVQDLWFEGVIRTICFGNHDQMAISGMLLGEAHWLKQWLQLHGGGLTLQQYNALYGSMYPLMEDLDWLAAVGMHSHLVEGECENYLCVHGAATAEMPPPTTHLSDIGGFYGPEDYSHLWVYAEKYPPKDTVSYIPQGLKAVYSHTLGERKLARFEPKYHAYFMDIKPYRTYRYAYLDAIDGSLHHLYLPPMSN